MTCGSCSYHEHIMNLAIGASRPPVLGCGTTFHPDCGDRDCPSTPSDNLWNLIYLSTEARSDSFEFIGSIQINLSIYTLPLHLYWYCENNCGTVSRTTHKSKHLIHGRNNYTSDNNIQGVSEKTTAANFLRKTSLLHISLKKSIYFWYTKPCAYKFWKVFISFGKCHYTTLTSPLLTPSVQ